VAVSVLLARRRWRSYRPLTALTLRVMESGVKRRIARRGWALRLDQNELLLGGARKSVDDVNGFIRSCLGRPPRQTVAASGRRSGRQCLPSLGIVLAIELPRRGRNRISGTSADFTGSPSNDLHAPTLRVPGHADQPQKNENRFGRVKSLNIG
jgi:hypothetical protein